jgi:hypothetical protein
MKTSLDDEGLAAGAIRDPNPLAGARSGETGFSI